MKIIIFGCQQIAVDLIRHIKRNTNHKVPLVVTYELPLDITYDYESVADTCDEFNIEYIKTTENPKYLVEKIKEISPDLILSVYYRRYIPKSIYSLASLGSFNIHPSKLPFYRGPVPTMWAIQNGESEYGITIHAIDDGIDTGDILYQEIHPIDPEDTGYSLYLKAMKNGANLLIKNLDNILDKNYETKKQVGYGSYYGKYNGQGFINWAQPCKNVINFIRARSKPFNPAQTAILNAYIFVNKASIFNSSEYMAVPPGQIIKVDECDKIIVACADGCISLDDYDIYPPLNKISRKIYLKKGVKLK